jgi:hypothetical protein
VRRRGLGLAIAAILLAAAAVATMSFEIASPHVPDAFTGQVYALPVPLGPQVYVTAMQHDLVATTLWGGLAALFVALVLSPALRRDKR